MVHQKCVSCTNGTPLYIRCIQRPHHVHFLSKNNRGPVFHVWNSHAYLKRHSLDNQRVGVPGMNIFTHLRVSAPGTGRSIGVPDFQVRETIRTWNGIYLIANELIFQVWIYSRTWALRHIMVCQALDPHNIMSGWFWRRYIPLTDTVTLVSFLYACKRLDVGTIRRKIVNLYIFPLIYRENIHTPTLAGSSRHLPIVKTLAYSRYFHKLCAAGWDYVSNPGKGCDMASPCQADFCKTNNGAPRFQSFLQGAEVSLEDTWQIYYKYET